MGVLRAKCVLVGDCTVGKSAVAQVFHSDGTMFPKNYSMTIGIELLQKLVPLEEKSEFVDIFLFDSAGKDVFSDMCEKHWDGIGMIAVVFDLTNVDTLTDCEKWIKHIRGFASPEKTIPAALIGNKADLEQRRQVTTEEGMELAEKYSMKYFETSAKANEGVEEPFKWLAQTFHDAHQDSSDSVEILQ